MRDLSKRATRIMSAGATVMTSLGKLCSRCRGSHCVANAHLQVFHPSMTDDCYLQWPLAVVDCELRARGHGLRSNGKRPTLTACLKCHLFYNFFR